MKCDKHKDRGFSYAYISVKKLTNPLLCSTCYLDKNKELKSSEFISIEDINLSSQNNLIFNWPLGINKEIYYQMKNICDSRDSESQQSQQIEAYYKQLLSKIIQIIEECKQQSIKGLQRVRENEQELLRFYNQNFQTDQLKEIFANKNSFNLSKFHFLLNQVNQSKDTNLNELNLKIKEEEKIRIEFEQSLNATKINQIMESIKLLLNQEINKNQIKIEVTNQVQMNNQNRWQKQGQSQERQLQQRLQKYHQQSQSLNKLEIYINYNQNLRNRSLVWNRDRQYQFQRNQTTNSIQRDKTADTIPEKTSYTYQQQNRNLSNKNIEHITELAEEQEILLRNPYGIHSKEMIQNSNINVENQQQLSDDSIIVQNNDQFDEIRSQIFIPHYYDHILKKEIDIQFQRSDFGKSKKIFFNKDEKGCYYFTNQMRGYKGQIITSQPLSKECTYILQFKFNKPMYKCNQFVIGLVREDLINEAPSITQQRIITNDNQRDIVVRKGNFIEDLKNKDEIDQVEMRICLKKLIIQYSDHPKNMNVYQNSAKLGPSKNYRLVIFFNESDDKIITLTSFQTQKKFIPFIQ